MKLKWKKDSLVLEWMPPLGPDSKPEHVTSYCVWKKNNKGKTLIQTVKVNTVGKCHYQFPLMLSLNHVYTDTEFRVNAVRNYHEGPEEELKIIGVTIRKQRGKKLADVEYTAMDSVQRKIVKQSVTVVLDIGLEKPEHKDSNSSAGNTPFPSLGKHSNWRSILSFLVCVLPLCLEIHILQNINIGLLCPYCFYKRIIILLKTYLSLQTIFFIV